LFKITFNFGCGSAALDVFYLKLLIANGTKLFTQKLTALGFGNAVETQL